MPSNMTDEEKERDVKMFESMINNSTHKNDQMSEEEMKVMMKSMLESGKAGGKVPDDMHYFGSTIPDSEFEKRNQTHV